jgi:DNA-directed RNA polymerase specialized sigma24 family protein
LSIKDIKSDLREIRNLNKRKIVNELTERYERLFGGLPPLSGKVMYECYIRGKSFEECGRLIYYCERSIHRIVKQSIEQLARIARNQEG